MTFCIKGLQFFSAQISTMRGRLFHGILAFGLLAIPATAQEILKSFDFYSAEDCGRNATEDSTTIDIFRIDIKDGDKDFISNCANTYIGLPNWPMENGQYKVFVDTSPIDEKCQLIFFTGPPSDDDVNTNTCFQFYRAINDNSGCARLTIPEHFGYAYVFPVLHHHPPPITHLLYPTHEVKDWNLTRDPLK